MTDSTPRTLEPGSAVPSDAAPGAPPTLERRVSRIRLPRRIVGAAFGGITAVGIKELRGRMRGRRAFVILTVYLLLLAGFGWMMELILERQHSGAVAGTAALASAQIGQGIFIAMLMLETLLVIALAPAFTAGAISLEREKQTLDMLATTPVSSLSIVLGKLLSALTYLFILIFASIPLTAMVFVFGGVSPDDVVRGYAVLLATALGLGSVGLFCSALMRRTQAATIATYFAVLGVTIGSFFVFYFWNTVAGVSGAGLGPLKGRPPEALVYLNPYFAQADVMCGVEAGFGDWCSQVAYVSNRSIFPTVVPVSPEPLPAGLGVKPQPVVIPADGSEKGAILGDVGPVQPFGVVRDSLWPKSVAAWLVVSALLIVGSIQLVTPTRRLRLRVPSFVRWPKRVSP